MMLFFHLFITIILKAVFLSTDLPAILTPSYRAREKFFYNFVADGRRPTDLLGKICKTTGCPGTGAGPSDVFLRTWEPNSDMTTCTCPSTRWLRKLTVIRYWRNALLGRKWRSSASNEDTTTCGGPPNDDPSPPITPKTGGSHPHNGLMIGGQVGGVGLPLVLHWHQAQAGEVRFHFTTNTNAQLPSIVNHIAGSNDDRHCR